MRPSVLIIEDSPSTADLARLALANVRCEVEVADCASRALELLAASFAPRVMVVDTYLPGEQPLPLLELLHATVPGAAMVLLIDHGVAAPSAPCVCAHLLKPLRPRMFASLVAELLVSGEWQGDAGER